MFFNPKGLFLHRMAPTDQQTAFEPEPRSLSSLLNEVRQVLRGVFSTPQYVVAEVAGLNESQRGHLYFNLVERKEEKTLAQARGNLWAGKKKRVVERFERETRTSLKKGMKILLIARVEFHPVYGMSLMIEDIDPHYTLGEIERQKKETLKRLEKEGLLDLNGKCPLPSVLQRLAIVSSPTAAGYQDLLEHLGNNGYGYTFHTILFPAIVQGDEAPSSIEAAFQSIKGHKKGFDAVLLIRGGGSSTDLGCFDEYLVARAVAHSNLPVLSGIGHERDRTIADQVAHTALKTPTAVANFIIDRNMRFESGLIDVQDRLSKGARRVLSVEMERFTGLTGKIRERARGFLQAHHKRIETIKGGMRKGVVRTFSREQKRIGETAVGFRARVPRLLRRQKEGLTQKQKHISLADPVNILKRGFSITTRNGKPVKNVEDLEEGSTLRTRVAKGSFDSRVQTVYSQKESENERIDPNPARG